MRKKKRNRVICSDRSIWPLIIYSDTSRTWLKDTSKGKSLGFVGFVVLNAGSFHSVTDLDMVPA